MRMFELHRDADETGISGVGRVAEGCEFSDGSASLRWLTKHRSTSTYASMDDVEAIHGHGGKTRIVWVTDAFDHGRQNCVQDACENVPFSSIGGLDARFDPQRPKYVREQDWAEYRRGYEHQAFAAYGPGWRTCEFGWVPALTIGAPKDETPGVDPVVKPGEALINGKPL